MKKSTIGKFSVSRRGNFQIYICNQYFQLPTQYRHLSGQQIDLPHFLLWLDINKIDIKNRYLIDPSCPAPVYTEEQKAEHANRMAYFDNCKRWNQKKIEHIKEHIDYYRDAWADQDEDFEQLVRDNMENK